MYNDANGADDEENDPSGGDDAGGIVDSNTMAKSNGDSNDVKNGAKKSAGVDSAPLSDLKDRIIKEVKRSNSPSTLKSVENILHELNTH